MTRIVAYTYDAAAHCPDCTRARFADAYKYTWHPRDEHGLPDYAPEDKKAMRDREGNAVHPVFSTDEDAAGFCDTCGASYGAVP